MPKKAAHSKTRGIYNITEGVCLTSDAYARALEHFRTILLARVSHHEDEVFSARARFQMQREQDRAHFERLQRRRHRAGNSGRSRSTVLRQLDHGVHGEDVVSDSMSSTEEEFCADQQKLYIEHEEELQKVYPLAYLSEESAGVVVFALLPTLRGKLMALAQQRTEGLKEHMKVLEENGCVVPGVNNNDCINVPSTSNLQRRAGGVEKMQLASVKTEHEQVRDTTVPEIGRGAYIIPLAHSSPSITQSCRAGVVSGGVRHGEADETEEVVEEQELPPQPQPQPPQQDQGKGDGDNNLVQPTWLTSLTTRGAVEFARIAFLCNEQHRRERHEEKRRCLERCLNASTTQAKERLVRRLLRRVKEEELHDMKRTAELLQECQAMEERVVGNGKDTVLDDTRIATAAGTKDEAVEAWISPSDLRREIRRARMELIGGNKNGNSGGNRTTLVSSALTTTTTNNNKNNNNNGFSCCCAFLCGGEEYLSSFDTTHWLTIPLDDNTNDDGRGSGVDLEAVAESYMWPKAIEEGISNVLCGEVVRRGKRLLLFQSDMVGKGHSLNKEGDGNGTAEDYVPTQQRHDGVEKQFTASLPVVALPQYGKKVWLKINTLGDFIAGEVKLYQSHSPL